MTSPATPSDAAEPELDAADPPTGSAETGSATPDSGTPAYCRDRDETPPAATEPDEPDDKGDREAAKYRRQLRSTEAERDRLAEQVEGYHRLEAERLAASRLIDASDLWAGGAKLADLLDDAGQVDPARVAQAVADLAASRPHWCRQAAAPSSTVGFGASKPDTVSDKPVATWSDVFTRHRNGTDG